MQHPEKQVPHEMNYLKTTGDLWKQKSGILLLRKGRRNQVPAFTAAAELAESTEMFIIDLPKS